MSSKKETAGAKLGALKLVPDTALFFASLKNATGEVSQLFLDAGLNPDLKDSQGTPAIVHAARHHRMDAGPVALAIGGESQHQERSGTHAPDVGRRPRPNGNRQDVASE
jgi:ankyrin repeat protein